jgi:hypothetical protein
MIGNSQSVSNGLSQLSQAGNMNTMTAIGKGGGAKMPPPPAGGPPGGPMLDALTQALSQLGLGNRSNASTTGMVTAVDSSSATEATSNPTQALTSFMQSLMAALHAQSGQDAGADSAGASNRSGTASGTQGTGYRPDIGADMQSLIQDLASTGAGSATSGNAADSSLTKLQESFQTLVSASGGSNSKVTLSGFLQNFASNMSGASSSGNFVSKKV